MRYISFVFVIFSGAVFSVAQQSPSATSPATPPATPSVKETVIVVGEPEAVTLGESPRSVVAIDAQQHPLAFEAPADYLRTDPSTYIEQRGAGGGQADISMRGSSFEQTLVLMNGLRIDDAQSSHHNLDLPVPLEAMRGIQVLHGAGSTLYGSDALGGVVDFLTAEPQTTSARLSAGAGSFGENEQSALIGVVGRQWDGMLTGARNFSTGFIADRDYRNESASFEPRLKSALGVTDILLAGSDRAFGANQFYGPYDSWERTKGWLATARQELGNDTEAAFGYRRHTDEYVLLRDDPAYYENNHIDSSWQAVLRRKDAIAHGGMLFYGLEANGDAIDSNNLGRHARNEGAGYLSAEMRPAKQWSFSAGLRAEILSGGAQMVWSPNLAASFMAAQNVKLRASVGHGFRLPTYTDLYYSDPTTIGNPSLKPESAWSVDGGVDWYANAKTAVSLTVFYSQQHDAIDYVRADASDPWQATNLQGLRFTGVEGSLRWTPTRNQTIQLGWTGISGAQNALHGLQSEYIFNYPVNNASFEWTDVLKGAYLVRTRVAVTERYQQTPYPVWDVETAREKGWIHPYLRAANLSNTGYQEIAGVPMPGRSFQGGVEIELGHLRQK
jgi:iron complex outermembrane receptor protein